MAGQGRRSHPVVNRGGQRDRSIEPVIGALPELDEPELRIIVDENGVFEPGQMCMMEQFPELIRFRRRLSTRIPLVMGDFSGPIGEQERGEIGQEEDGQSV